MEEHLKQLCNENPLLLTTIQGAIFSGYEQAKSQEICHSKRL